MFAHCYNKEIIKKMKGLKLRGKNPFILSKLQ